MPEVGSVIFEQSPKLCRVLGFFFTLACFFVVRSHAKPQQMIEAAP
jgi:hypothetical protein